MKIKNTDIISKLELELQTDVDSEYFGILKPSEEVLIFIKDPIQLKEGIYKPQLLFMDSLKNICINYMLENYTKFFKKKVSRENIEPFFDFDEDSNMSVSLYTSPSPRD